LEQAIGLVEMVLITLYQVLFNPFFWVVVLLVGLQYKKLAGTRRKLFDGPEEPAWRPTLLATLYGLVGGLVGSFLMVFLGISLSGIGIGTLWMVAIALMLISPRFMCFAYAGSLISISYLLVGFPKVNIPELMGLIAILHMVEALLILISGHLGAIPVYTKDKNGNLIGGFTLQKLWPIPIVVLFAVSVPEGVANGGIGMPAWWPLIRSGLSETDPNILYSMLPVVAGLGYGDLALARKPMEKAKLSSRYLAIYSVILLLLAILATTHFYPFAIFAALFAALGHEWIIKLGQKVEFNNDPIYAPVERGVKILDLSPASPLAIIGLESGDVILNLNDYPVNNKEQLKYAVEYYYGPMEIEFLKEGKKLYRDVFTLQYQESLGILPVPEGNETEYVELRTTGLFKHLFERTKKKIFK